MLTGKSFNDTGLFRTGRRIGYIDQVAVHGMNAVNIFSVRLMQQRIVLRRCGKKAT